MITLKVFWIRFYSMRNVFIKIRQVCFEGPLKDFSPFFMVLFCQAFSCKSSTKRLNKTAHFNYKTIQYERRRAGDSILKRKWREKVIDVKRSIGVLKTNLNTSVPLSLTWLSYHYRVMWQRRTLFDHTSIPSRHKIPFETSKDT